jgi:benzylsuccinate CoA-transferase BbsE subunit
MTEGGALQDLRVIDLTDDTGRFATKLLTEAGADVIRVGPDSPGAAMQGEAGKYGGLLDWWYDGGKQRLALNLDSPDGQRQFKDLAARADLLIETEPPGRLARLGLDFPDLHALNPRLVHVSLTPFGRRCLPEHALILNSDQVIKSQQEGKGHDDDAHIQIRCYPRPTQAPGD